MFGDLFEQDIAGDKQKFVESMNAQPKKRFIADDMELPPPTRSGGEFAGLVNKGATCYLNSLFQSLYFNPELRALLLSLDLDAPGSKYKKDSNKYKILKEIQLFFSRLRYSSVKNQNTKVLDIEIGLD
jgi:ubiquitin C-terminal hydrolase